MALEKNTFYQRERFSAHHSPENAENSDKPNLETVWFRTLLQQLVIGSNDQNSEPNSLTGDGDFKHKPENYQSSYQYLAELAWQIDSENIGKY